jgi:hypothetical protein
MEKVWGCTTDGWDDRGDLSDVGLMEWIEDAERTAYELRNAVRGSYAGFGDTPADLVNHLKGLATSLKQIAEDMEEYV